MFVEELAQTGFVCLAELFDAVPNGLPTTSSIYLPPFPSHRMESFCEMDKNSPPTWNPASPETRVRQIMRAFKAMTH